MAWSPDGEWIAVSTVRSGPPGNPGAATPDGIFVLRPDGSDATRVSRAEAHGSLAWQPLPG